MTGNGEGSPEESAWPLWPHVLLAIAFLVVVAVGIATVVVPELSETPTPGTAAPSAIPKQSVPSNR